MAENVSGLISEVLEGFSENLRTRQAIDAKKAAGDFDRSIKLAELKQGSRRLEQGARRLEIDEFIRTEGLDIRREETARKKTNDLMRFYRTIFTEPKTIQAGLMKLNAEGKDISSPEIQALLSINEELKQKKTPQLTPKQRADIISESFERQESSLLGEGAGRAQLFGSSAPGTVGELRGFVSTDAELQSDTTLSRIIRQLENPATFSLDSLLARDPILGELLGQARKRQNGQKKIIPKWQELGFESEKEFNKAFEAEKKKRGLK